MKDTVNVRGAIVIEWVEDGVVVKRRRVNNLVTTLGVGLFASLVGGSGVAPSYIALGSGYDGPTIADLALQTEVARAPVISTVVASPSVQYTATFGPGVATGTHREAGLFNASTAGTMSNRAVFATPLVKASYQTINIIWLISFN